MPNAEEEKFNFEKREQEENEKKPRVKPIIEAADSLSLGISMVVAVLMGVGIGFVIRSLSGVAWTLWIGIFIGVAAAVLNVYKAYSKQYKAMEELAKEPRYAMKKQLEEDDDEDYSEKHY